MRKETGHRMRQLGCSGAGHTAKGTSKLKKTTCMALWPTSSLSGSDYSVPQFASNTNNPQTLLLFYTFLLFHSFILFHCYANGQKLGLDLNGVYETYTKNIQINQNHNHSVQFQALKAMKNWLVLLNSFSLSDMGTKLNIWHSMQKHKYILKQFLKNLK